MKRPADVLKQLQKTHVATSSFNKMNIPPSRRERPSSHHYVLVWERMPYSTLLKQRLKRLSVKATCQNGWFKINK